jgi:hypothetical protein
MSTFHIRGFQARSFIEVSNEQFSIHDRMRSGSPTPTCSLVACHTKPLLLFAYSLPIHPGPIPFSTASNLSCAPCSAIISATASLIRAIGLWCMVCLVVSIFEADVNEQCGRCHTHSGPQQTTHQHVSARYTSAETALKRSFHLYAHSELLRSRLLPPTTLVSRVCNPRAPETQLGIALPHSSLVAFSHGYTRESLECQLSLIGQSQMNCSLHLCITTVQHHRLHVNRVR